MQRSLHSSGWLRRLERLPTTHTPRVALTSATQLGLFRGAFLHLYDFDPGFASDLLHLYRRRVSSLTYPLPPQLTDWWWEVGRPDTDATLYLADLVELAANHGLDRFHDDPEPGIGLRQIHAWCEMRQSLRPRPWPPSRFSEGTPIALEEPAIFPIVRRPEVASNGLHLPFAVVSEDEARDGWDPREDPRRDAEARLQGAGLDRRTTRGELQRIDVLATIAGYQIGRARGEGTASDLARDFRWLYRRVHGETSMAIAASEGDPRIEHIVHRQAGRLARRVGISVRGWDQAPD